MRQKTFNVEISIFIWGTEVKLKCYGSIRITARANRNELILNALKIKKLFLNILKRA